MSKFQARQRFRKVIYSKLTLFILAALLAIFAKSTYGLWEKYRDIAKARAVEEAELAALLAKEDTLSNRVSALKTSRGVEEAIREKFKVAKEGEGVVVVIDQKDTADSMVDDENPFMSFMRRLFGF
ncbi:septum formation initiator family protein [Candidatus Parcubacteria bacterium]|nr:septum formation initiator family protein [Candidatus Parcubacteria bacterium]